MIDTDSIKKISQNLSKVSQIKTVVWPYNDKPQKTPLSLLAPVAVVVCSCRADRGSPLQSAERYVPCKYCKSSVKQDFPTQRFWYCVLCLVVSGISVFFFCMSCCCGIQYTESKHILVPKQSQNLKTQILLFLIFLFYFSLYCLTSAKQCFPLAQLLIKTMVEHLWKTIKPYPTIKSILLKAMFTFVFISPSYSNMVLIHW